MATVLEDHVTQAKTGVADTATRPTHAEIELRAYCIYVERGCVDGYALDDWLEAEADLREGNTLEVWDRPV